MKYDALVIGGGPGGSTAALLLARAGWSVAVLERASFPRRKVCGEYVSATNLPLFRLLGVENAFRELSGPPVRKVGLYAGKTILVSKMPNPRNGDFGRALGRENLDMMLLSEAARAGAIVWQPWSAVQLQKETDGYVCKAVQQETRETKEFRTRIVIAAHGSWERGRLPTQPDRRPPRASDLFGFKAHFTESDLPIGLMPLLVFRGGYGGMVHTDCGRVSLSCCIRRGQLDQLRREKAGAPAAEAVLFHIERSCLGVSRAIRNAMLNGPWLSAGPIRPGIRVRPAGRMFLVGNAAGEAHPIIAEGISMAAQAARLLCERLIANEKEVLSGSAIDETARSYAIDWRKNFAGRVRAASFFARLAMLPTATTAVLPLFRLFPKLLTIGAHVSGKVNQIEGGPLPIGSSSA